MSFNTVCVAILECINQKQYFDFFDFDDRKPMTNLCKNLFQMILIAKEYKPCSDLFDINNDVNRIKNIIMLCCDHNIKCPKDIESKDSVRHKLQSHQYLVAYNDLIYYYAISQDCRTYSLEKFFTKYMYHDREKGLIKQMPYYKNKQDNESKMFEYMIDKHSSFSLYKEYYKPTKCS